MDFAATASSAMIGGASILALAAILIGTALVAHGATVLVERGPTAAVYIGVILISLATTLPEIVLVGASLHTEPRIFDPTQNMLAELRGVYYPVGIIIGSTLTNLLLILGLTGMAFAKVGQGVDVGKITLWVLVFILALAAVTMCSAYVWPNFPLPDFAMQPSMWIGEMLLGLGLIYLILIFATEMDKRYRGGAADEKTADEQGEPSSQARSAIPIVFGLVLVSVGAYFLTKYVRLLVTLPFPAADGLKVSIDQPVALNQIRYGMFGLLIVGFLVALPEIFAIFFCRIGLKKRRPRDELATGTILGASILNLCLLLGVAILITSGGGYPVKIDPSLFATDATMILIAVGLIAVFFLMNMDLAWWEGAILFAIWLVYWTWRFWSTNEKIQDYVAQIDPTHLAQALLRGVT